MNTAQWEKLEVLLEQALALPPAQRPLFLAESCQDDPDLLAEALSLLEEAPSVGTFVHETARAVFQGNSTGKADTSQLPARKVLQYEVLEKLGDGGMGVVYKAQDTRLHRLVALKFLPAHLSTSEEAKQRLLHEARAASALDHPNIATIHEIGETEEGQLFIVMSYYDGETLKQKIARGPLPLDEALDFAIQIGQGLSKAHSMDIVHRDVKPANVMVTPDRLVKILDFGIAKVAGLNLTKTGTRLGTVAYMSPEQLRGDRVDQRIDFWSLGVLLYEMITGLHPFNAEYEQAITYSLLNIDPKPVTSLRAGLPLQLEHVLQKALAKAPEERYQHVADLLVDLRALQKESTAQTAHREAALRTTTLTSTSQTTTQISSPPTSTTSTPHAPLKILVVDDAPEFELLMKQSFYKKVRAKEWTFVFAMNGFEALEALEADPQIELILTDINMPEMDGLTLLTHLSELERPLKTIVVSAYGDMANIRTAMNRGAFDFVTKPIDLEDLETTVLKSERALRIHQKAARAEHQLVTFRKELEVARTIQETALPSASLTERRFDLHAFRMPAQEVAGDFYDFFPMEGKRLGFALGTVSGKGISTALFTVMSRTVLKAIALHGDVLPGPCVHHLQDLLFSKDIPDLTVNLFYGTLDTSTGELAYSQAGQQTLYLLKRNQVVPLPTDDSPALGQKADARYKTQVVNLRTGEGLFLCTKGLSQIRDAQRYSFHPEQLHTVLKQSPSASSAQYIRDVMREISRFTDGAPQSDDLTLMALRYLGA